MSSEKTANLGLNKWVPTDYVQMSEFNENFDKLDEQLADITNNTIYVIGTGGDDTIQLQNAFNNVQNGGCIYIKGTVRFTQDITSSDKKNVTIKGDGSSSSVILNISIGKTIKLTNWQYCDFANVSINGNGTISSTTNVDGTGGDGIQFDSCPEIRFINCGFSYHGGNGITLLQKCWVYTFENCYIVGNKLKGFQGLSKYNSVVSLQATAMSFVNCLIFKNLDIGIHFNATGLNINGGVIENNRIGLFLDASDVGCVGVSITGVDFELNADGAIVFKTTNTNYCSGIEISGNNFASNSQQTGQHFINVSADSGSYKVFNTRIGKNEYNGYTTIGIINLRNKCAESVTIEMPVIGLEQYFINVNGAFFTNVCQQKYLAGKDQTGITFTSLTSTGNLIGVSNPDVYWELPIRDNAMVSSVDLKVYTDVSASYTVYFYIYFLEKDGTITNSFTLTANKTTSGDALVSFPISLNKGFNRKMIIRSYITLPTTGATIFNVKGLFVYGNL